MDQFSCVVVAPMATLPWCSSGRAQVSPACPGWVHLHGQESKAGRRAALAGCGAAPVRCPHGSPVAATDPTRPSQNRPATSPTHHASHADHCPLLCCCAEDRGLFQVPTDACPKDFTGFATDAYKELAPVSKQGQYAWAVPQETGDYWITSQAGTDCADGRLMNAVLWCCLVRVVVR